MRNLAKHCKYNQYGIKDAIDGMAREYKKLSFFHTHQAFADEMVEEVARLARKRKSKANLNLMLNYLNEQITKLIEEKDSRVLLTMLTQVMANALDFEIDEGFLRAMQQRSAKSFLHEWLTNYEINFWRLNIYGSFVAVGLILAIASLPAMPLIEIAAVTVYFIESRAIMYASDRKKNHNASHHKVVNQVEYGLKSKPRFRFFKLRRKDKVRHPSTSSIHIVEREANVRTKNFMAWCAG